MPRSAAYLLTLAASLLGGLVAVRLAGAPDWRAPLAAGAVWVVLVGVRRAAHVTSLRRTLRDQPAGPRARELDDVAALRAVEGGGAGFSLRHGGFAALEAAVILGPARGPLRPEDRARAEDIVRSDVARCTPAALEAVVEGLERLTRSASVALDAPLHPLYPLAPGILRALGESPTRALADLRLAARRETRRALLGAASPAEIVALRLLAAGHDRAALDVVEDAAVSDFGRRLRRLARCRVLLLDAAQGDVAPPTGARAVRQVTELLLLAGRRMPDLVPGAPFLRAVPGGAAALERRVARTALTVAELAQLVVEAPELERPVATVLARAVGRPVGATVTALRKRSLVARPDAALRLHLRGLALLAENRDLEAAAEFEAALAQAPGFSQAAFSLAEAKRRAGRVSAGEAILRHLVERRPREAEPLVYLARYLSSVGERTRSREAYEIALGRFPHSMPLRVAFAQELIAWGESSDALEHLDIARRQLPREPRLGLLAGRTLATEGRLDEAASVLERAASGLAGQDRGEAWFWLMAVRRDQGDHTTAQRIARRLVRVLGAGQSSLLDDVADYLEERHDYDRAREASARARRLRGE